MSRSVDLDRRIPDPVRSKVARAAGLAIILTALVTGDATSQICFGPDNLNGGCCQPVIPNLPPFPAVQLPGAGICWTNCVAAPQTPLKIDWQLPVQTGCTQYTATLTVVDATNGFPILTGQMVLDYTRTFQESDPTGLSHQVWRFAAKADLSPVLVGIVPGCPTPSCLPPFGTEPAAFFYGYVDYTQPCVPGAAITENAMVLYHACDFFIHRPGLSSAAGVYHPNESYAIVAPVSAIQPFVPGNNIPSSGPLIGEGMRNTSIPLPIGCLSTDFIVQGQMGNLGGACLCPPAAAPKQHRFRPFAGQTACPDTTGVPGSFQALNIGFPNVLPWYHMTTSSIGRWTNNNLYPGQEYAFVDEGLFIQSDACAGQLVTIQYGGSTRFGWSIQHPVLLNGATDLASNYSVPLFGPYPFPIMGRVNPTDELIYVFTP